MDWERWGVLCGKGTADEVVRLGRFCQVRRQDDRGTCWLHEHWLAPNRDDLDLWFLALLYRCCINDGRVASEITCPLPWDGPRYLAEMAARNAKGKYTEHFGHHAYTIYTYRGFDFKPEGHVERLLNLAWARREYFRSRPGDTCATFYRRLLTLDGVGPFLAAQVVADCKFFPPLSTAPDVMSFAVPGPGSERGLARVLGKSLSFYKGREDAWQCDFQKLREQLAPEIEQILGELLSASDFQSALCECDKLERYRVDHGALQLYTPFDATAPSTRKASRSKHAEPVAAPTDTPAAARSIPTETPAPSDPPMPALYPPSAVRLFASLARQYIVPGAAKDAGLRLVFDLESDGLLADATKVHCVGGTGLDDDSVDEFGPEQIPAALEYLTQAAAVIGHNALTFDVPLLAQLHGWRPKIVRDTLVASRLILPNLADLDNEVAARTGASLGKLHGKYSLAAWGIRLGIPRVGTDIDVWAAWTPEIQERCAVDVTICKALWHFLQVDGYSQQAIELEHHVAVVCDQITRDGAPFDVAAAEYLQREWEARRDELERQLQQQLPN